MTHNPFLVELLLEDILRFHSALAASDIPVEDGIRDLALLESAVNAPFQTFGGEDLYPDITDKAARLLYGIANNHAFVDGNKRTAVHATEMFLLINGISLECDDIEMENIIIGVADNTISYEELSEWMKKHC